MAQRAAGTLPSLLGDGAGPGALTIGATPAHGMHQFMGKAIVCTEG